MWLIKPAADEIKCVLTLFAPRSDLLPSYLLPPITRKHRQQQQRQQQQFIHCHTSRSLTFLSSSPSPCPPYPHSRAWREQSRQAKKDVTMGIADAAARAFTISPGETEA